MIHTMKWFKKHNDIYAFELDGSQDFLITDEHAPMSDEEIDRHLNPGNYRTEEEHETMRLASFPILTRRQFMRTLVLSGVSLDFVEQQIKLIENIQVRQLALIDWTSATEFARTDSTLMLMASMLGLSSEEVDIMWQYALTV